MKMNNTMQKIFCRSIRDDGYGEGVVPEYPMPDESYFGDNYGKDTFFDSDGYNKAMEEWDTDLASRPLYALIHPDLAKGGWVGEHKEGYEYSAVKNKWIECSKEVYDKQHPAFCHRIVLVPVEGKAEENKPRCEKELHVIKYFGLPEDVSFNKVPKVTYADLVDLLFSWDETVKAKPTTVTGEAETWKKVEDFIRDCLFERHPSTTSIVEGLKFIFQQAASRTSDAVEFAEWLFGQGYTVYAETIVYQPTDYLYQLFKQQTTKP